MESSKFITSSKSEQLVGKLMTMAGEASAKELERHLYTAGRVKPENESIFRTVDIIFKAINAERQIAFEYCEYAPDKSFVSKHDGEQYVFSPYAMLYNEDKYYLLGYSEHHEKGGKIITYRVDRMKLPEILDTPIVPRPEGFDPVDYTVDVFSMFDGKPCRVRLRCENRLMNYVIDRFGEDVQTSIVSKERFDAVVDVSVSQTFFAWVFQFAGAMRIVSPKAVKEQYSEMLDKSREQVK